MDKKCCCWHFQGLLGSPETDPHSWETDPKKARQQVGEAILRMDEDELRHYLYPEEVAVILRLKGVVVTQPLATPPRPASTDTPSPASPR